MMRKTFVAMLIPLFTVSSSGAVFASGPVPGSAGQQQPAQKTQLGDTLSVLHAVNQWSTDLSQMAATKAKSDLVRNYARDMATANANTDTKIVRTAKQSAGIDVVPPDPQSEEGKSMLDRMNAEKAMLNSLDGDAFDKEYMTLVTNTQQSVLHFLNTNKSTATDPATKQLLSDMTTSIQSRQNRAQDIMAQIYGDKI